MLTAIKIGNFKAFAEPQRVPIRPLTLIYGANSSGKSSIIHSLIYAHHAMQTGELDVNYTEVGGEAVDLGGFKQFVHQRNTGLRLHVEWEVPKHDFNKRLKEELLPETKKAVIGINIGFNVGDRAWMKDDFGDWGELTPRKILLGLIEHFKKKGDQAEVEKYENMLTNSEKVLTLEEISELGRELRIENCWLDLDDKRFLTLSSRTSGNLQLDVLDRDHEATAYLISNLILAYSTVDHIDSEEIHALMETVDELVPKISFEIGKFLPQKLFRADELGSSSRGLSLITVRKETRSEDLKKVVEYYLPSFIEEILIGISEAVKQEIGKITYLGPLRTYPDRHVGFSQSNDPNWFAGGGSAWDLLRKNSTIRQKANEWLGDEKKLSTHYELRLRYLLTIESLKPKLEELSSRAISKLYNVEEGGDPFGEAEEEINEIPERIEKLESIFSDIQELVLYDKRSKTAVSHRDVGIGISQVLPVLVTSFASTNKLIAMEQPEIHLHPALQAELGDVFIESALGERKNTLIIESHSEHLLLRIMRRMRETCNGELPEGFPKVNPKDVCVLFVQPKGTSSAVCHLELDEEGQLLDAWPGGFFEEGYRERFS